MSNWQFHIPGVYTESVGFASTGNMPMSSFSWGTATTYSAWQSFSASFSRPVDGIFVHNATSDTDANRSMWCIAVGSGADANIIAKDIWFPGAYYLEPCVTFLPVRVPANQTIFVKLLTPASGNKRLGLIGVAGTFPVPVGYARCEGIGMDTTNCQPFGYTPVASGITWNQVIASTPSRYGAITLQDFAGDENLGSGQARLGIGGAGSEQELFRWFIAKNRDYGWGAMNAIPLDIPSGSRLSVAGYRSGTLGSTRRTNLIGFVH